MGGWDTGDSGMIPNRGKLCVCYLGLRLYARDSGLIRRRAELTVCCLGLKLLRARRAPLVMTHFRCQE